jgi:hypothetical protein
MYQLPYPPSNQSPCLGSMTAPEFDPYAPSLQVKADNNEPCITPESLFESLIASLNVVFDAVIMLPLQERSGVVLPRARPTSSISTPTTITAPDYTTHEHHHQSAM